LTVIIEGRQQTALQAAEKFAAEAFEHPRRIAKWEGNTFRLVNGKSWYGIQAHSRGWEIREVVAVY
jgi:hypothetical protein